jgi:hypothetical protein
MMSIRANSCLWRRLITVTTSLTIACASQAEPVWVQWSSSEGGNDHWYSFVNKGSALSWIDADNYATIEGAYLATTTSQAENDFVYSQITSWSSVQGYPNGWGGPWLGAFAPDNRPNPASGWQWVTGEQWSFTDWNSSRFNQEPNNSGGHENYLMITNLNDGLSLDVVGTWNDLGVNGTGTYVTTSYMMERNTAPVPEPATISILGLGSYALLRKRKAKQ